MINKNKLRAAIARAGLYMKDVCKYIGISQPTFIRKVKHNTFGINEIMIMKDVLKLTNDELIEIFFATDVT